MQMEAGGKSWGATYREFDVMLKSPQCQTQMMICSYHISSAAET